MPTKYSRMVSMQAVGFQGKSDVAGELVKTKSDAETAGDSPARA